MIRRCVHAGLLLTMCVSSAAADPCGMVPPLQSGDVAAEDTLRAIERIGIQRTYVAYRDGIETMVLRPGFQGSIDNFGMLIPFPSPPTIRKIEDDTFAHIEAALRPPELRLYLEQMRPIEPSVFSDAMDGIFATSGANVGNPVLGYEEVRVVRQEAVGMYEAAVLEAGSPAALARWMGAHGYRYPTGMDDVTAEYVQDGWCFVAIKARVGAASGVEPAPGIRRVDPQLPAGATFDGYVQGMGFRFETDEPVVPMRLSIFNGDAPYNVLYMLSDEPLTINGLPDHIPTHHISGEELLQNLVAPLEVNIQSGEEEWLTNDMQARLDALRDGAPYSTRARELFAADLLAMKTGQLSLAAEGNATTLLNISEELGLRGPEIDALHRQALQHEQQQIVETALEDLRGMHMSVIAGVFPTALLRDDNLTFSPIEETHTAPIGYHVDPLQPADIVGRGYFYESGTNSLDIQRPTGVNAFRKVPPVSILTLTGELDAQAALQTLWRNQQTFEVCYRSYRDTARVSPNNLAEFDLTIEQNGRVSQVIHNTLMDDTVERCLSEKLKALRFPATDDIAFLEVRVGLYL